MYAYMYIHVYVYAHVYTVSVAGQLETCQSTYAMIPLCVCVCKYNMFIRMHVLVQLACTLLPEMHSRLHNTHSRSEQAHCA